MIRWRSSCSLLTSCLARRHAPVALHSSSAQAAIVRGKTTTAGTSISSTIDFSDTKTSFQNKSTYELWRAFVLFKLFKYEKLVDKSEKLLGLLKSIVGDRLFTKVMKATIFGHFVAGETGEEVNSTLTRLESQGILPILAYSAEDDVTESETKSTSERDAATERACDNNLKNAIDCLNVVADASQYPFSATKITGLGHTSLLLLLSEVLVGSEKVFSLLADKPDMLEGVVTSDSFLRGTEKMKLGFKENEVEKLWKTLKTNYDNKLNFFEWNDAFLTDGSDFYEVLAKHSPHELNLPLMSEEEKDQMKSVMRRMESLADVAQERGVRLMIDAEHTYYQPAIRHITVHRLMPKYNMQYPLLYNTQQCYLRSSFNDLLRDIAASEHYGYRFAIKTVRGAYVTLEKALALKKGYPDPIWGKKSETDSSYHRILNHVLERVGEGKASIMVATHNEATVHFALKKVNELGLNKTDSSVVFGQQYGMSDNLTCTLGSSGLMAYKYTPYGPVGEVLPYLIRRANENKGMLDGAVRERSLISRELKRRLMRKN
ncbi:PREDICTED: proline dehydrogenase 1, mitochondrial-like isoform X2 [Amphimedon queenslandica]|uniref:Proline dehydrogenase n=1 Tax=Amphimedon queenslandica TaxID=400682 RepID=A0A1X7UM25_AMPQE|nr:PREDICTED: proline dehydrogenase 1, mitochondrial-like isoform X2 [Amphimedon queenslandica]|eukprot:XP_003387388.1 PREDICTED: proline dehydrogenase 1, mitochondrial-like isoform X2 [Amphimedon queenslandica]